MILNFEITNQILKRTDHNLIVSKSKNYIQIQFKFKTSDWTDLNKFVIFKDSWGDAYTLNLGTECDTTVTVPEEALKGNFFKVTVYGGDRITTDEKTVPIIPSGYTEKIKIPEGTAPDIFVQIFNALDEKVSEITYNDGVMEIYSNNGLLASYDLFSDIRDEFAPLIHTHTSDDVSDFDLKTGTEVKAGLRRLATRIRTGD